jgi:hypothetical protein
MMTLLISHGIMLMKPLEHQALFEVTTFQDKLVRWTPIKGVQEWGHKKSRKGEENVNDSSNEELEEDPHDDMNVSDSDEGSGGSDKEENDPTFNDEFDEGYWENLRDESVI